MADKEGLGPAPTDKETPIATTSHPIDEEIAARSKQTQKYPGESPPNPPTSNLLQNLVLIDEKVKWYHSTFYNALILGICNFLAPGIWGAMNSLGGGGDEKPYLVNTANALTFCLMVLSCFFGTVIVKYIGIKWTFIVGTVGYAPFAAGLYTHNRYGTDWLVLFGAALCGLSAGIFWMAEAAIALAYPEPYNQGRFLGFWLSFRVSGQILGGAVNLGINAKDSHAGKVSYTVFELFIALQALAPFVGLLLSPPKKVQRTDGLPVRLRIFDQKWTAELKEVVKLFVSRDFLLIVPLICQAVYSEAVMFTYQGLWFSVRARALGSFLSGIVALISGNLLGAYLDNRKVSLKTRARTSFIVVLGLQGAWWIWGTVLVTRYNRTNPVYDWTDPGFGAGFALFLFWVIGFQVNYLYLYVSILGCDMEILTRVDTSSSVTWPKMSRMSSASQVCFVGQSLLLKLLA